MTSRFLRIKPGTKFRSPSRRLDKNPAIFDEAECVSLGLVGRVRILKLAILVALQVDKAALQISGQNTTNFLDGTDHLACEI